MTMCECVADMAKKLTEKFDEWQGKTVERFEPSDAMLDFETGKTAYGVGFDIEIKGQQKRAHTMVTFKFCPFCGEKKA